PPAPLPVLALSKNSLKTIKAAWALLLVSGRHDLEHRRMPDRHRHGDVRIERLEKIAHPLDCPEIVDIAVVVSGQDRKLLRLVGFGVKMPGLRHGNHTVSCSVLDQQRNLHSL